MVPHSQQKTFNFHLPVNFPVQCFQLADTSHKFYTQFKSIAKECGSRATKTFAMEGGVCVRNSASSKRANFNPEKRCRLRKYRRGIWGVDISRDASVASPCVKEKKTPGLCAHNYSCRVKTSYYCDYSPCYIGSINIKYYQFKNTDYDY